jgi:hypothetical protein
MTEAVPNEVVELIPKLDSRQVVFQPLYVPLTSAIGFVLVLLLFTWHYPVPGDDIGQKFVKVPEFWIWIFELAVMCAMLTVAFGPLWKQFFDLYRAQVGRKKATQRSATLLMLLIGVLIYLFLVTALYTMTPSSAFPSAAGLQPLPEGHHVRIMIIYAYALVTLLPWMGSILLIYAGVLDKARQIEAAAPDQARLFGIANDLLRYRTLLQNLLLIAGVIVSLVPIATATLRSIFIKVGIATIDSFPLTTVMVYALFFTMILIVFYVPTHLQLADTSRKLRDALCPIRDLPTLDDTLRKRKTLDDWLQTNIGLADNLKAGIFALAPLVSGFVTTVLGIK